MQGFIDLYKNSETLHHAYFFVSHEVDEVVSKLKHFLEEHLGIKTHGNPDVTHHQFKTLTIDEARQLATASERKSFVQGLTLHNSKKIFIIEADFITEEAQNSLLKVFEEPTAGTHFFIISPQDILLPTLRSRMQVINVSKGVLDTKQSILDLTPAERLVKVKEITDAIKDSDPSLQSYDEAKRTKQDAISLLNQIERELYEKFCGNQMSTECAQSLKVCEEARQALYDRGAPVKMILENVMLSI